MGLCLFSRVCVCVCVCVWGALSRLSSGQWQGMAHRQQDRVLHATTKAQTGFPGDAGEGDMYDGDVGADMSSAAAAGAGMLQKRLRDSLNRMKEQQCLISNPYPRKTPAAAAGTSNTHGMTASNAQHPQATLNEQQLNSSWKRQSGTIYKPPSNAYSAPKKEFGVVRLRIPKMLRDVEEERDLRRLGMSGGSLQASLDRRSRSPSLSRSLQPSPSPVVGPPGRAVRRLNQSTGQRDLAGTGSQVFHQSSGTLSSLSGVPPRHPLTMGALGSSSGDVLPQLAFGSRQSTPSSSTRVLSPLEHHIEEEIECVSPSARIGHHYTPTALSPLAVQKLKRDAAAAEGGMSWTGSGLSHETVPQRKPLKTKYSLEDLKTPRTEIFTLLHKDGCNPSSTFLPLEVFDDEDAERYAPFDWIAEQEGGVLVHSRYFVGEEQWEWRPARVFFYEPQVQAFYVEWCEMPDDLPEDEEERAAVEATRAPKTNPLDMPGKYVRRFNLRFLDEDAEEFEHRLLEAAVRREQAEEYLRTQMYLDENIPDSEIPPMNQEQVHRIIDLCHSDFPPELMPMVESFFQDMKDNYIRAIKLATLNYERLNPEFAERIENLHLAPMPEKEGVPFSTVLTIPGYSNSVFQEICQTIHSRLLIASPSALAVMQYLHHEWVERFGKTSLFNLKYEEGTIEDLRTFVSKNNNHGLEVVEVFREDYLSSCCSACSDFMEHDFNFYIRTIEEYETSLLFRALRVFHLVLNQQVRDLVMGSLQQYVDFIERFDGLGRRHVLKQVSEEHLTDAQKELPLETLDIEELGIPYYEVHQFQNHRFSDSPVTFELSLIIEDNQLAVYPSIKYLEDSLLLAFDRVIDMTKGTIPHIDKHILPLISLEDQFFGGVDHEEEEVMELRNRLAGVLERAVIGMEVFAEVYEEYIPLMHTDAQEYVEQVRDHATLVARQAQMEKDPTDGQAPYLEEFRKEIQRYIDLAQEVRLRTPREVNFNMFTLAVDQAQNVLHDKAREVADALLSCLCDETREQVSAIATNFQYFFDALQRRPENPEELVELRRMIDDNQQSLNLWARQLRLIGLNMDLLSSFSYSLEDSDFSIFYKSMSWPRRIENRLAELEDILNDNKKKFIEQLRQNQEELGKDIASLNEQVMSFVGCGQLEDAHENAKKVSAIKELLEDAEERARTYRVHEHLFGLVQTDYPHLENLGRNFDPYHKLWTTASEFMINHPDWMDSAFERLDGNRVERLVKTWQLDLKRLDRVLKSVEEPHKAVTTIAAQVDEFRVHIPLIQYLGNKGMRERHWEELNRKIGFVVEPQDDESLTDLLEKGLENYLPEIKRVSELATQEYRIEKRLEEMRLEWRKICFTVVMHPDGRGLMLKGVDEIQEKLEEHIVKTQQMLSSPYIAAFERHAKDWESRLLRVQEVIEAWLNVQRQWLYLAPIFNSDDIQQQLPTEAKRFETVNKLWCRTMEDTQRSPAVLQATSGVTMLDKFEHALKFLDIIQKGLNEYLESKRLEFPRFFFLSNDELLNILSESKKPTRVQPHLKKCFENIDQLEFQSNLDITAMYSAEGERVIFDEIINPGTWNNRVEKWLPEVEGVMQTSLARIMHEALQSYPSTTRERWMLRWPGQVILTVSQLIWTAEVTDCLNAQGSAGLREYLLKINKQMDKLINVVRGELTTLHRITLGALVVLDVHSRDVVARMISEHVSSPEDFEFQSQLRYYWEDDTVMVHMLNTCIEYGFEYLGNTSRLVITPLTDRAYRTLMSAFHLHLGGAPEGPAGTGKTETVKDLAKHISKQCRVFNCSEGLDHKIMGRMFKGLASCGAWSCLDEFNRLELEVLSVIAQQILTIQESLASHASHLTLDGSYISLDATCAIFTTMNPGYAGRAELPDNLKALFRPVAMMIPDYKLISEITLFSSGFHQGSILARKLVATYRLCSEQLSKQAHYDYGMRAVKAVLNAAGVLKRKYPTLDESVLMLRAITDVNMPKFLHQDMELFLGIVTDLFPGVKPFEPDYLALREAIFKAGMELDLQMREDVQMPNSDVLPPPNLFSQKVLQLYETMNVRHGLMLVGEPMAGKSSAYKVLARALNIMNEDGLMDENAVEYEVINPKSIDMDQLYGVLDENTNEWRDGILARLFRKFAEEGSATRHWIVLDGPVDALWIETMNTVLDDNRMLCLMSGEVIPMPRTMNLLFEVQNLKAASPATVSRCGMVYMDPSELGWRSLLRSWLNELPESLSRFENDMLILVEWFVPPALDLVMEQPRTVPVTEMSLVFSMLRLWRTQLSEFFGAASSQPLDRTTQAVIIQAGFLFALIWSLGACTLLECRRVFSDFVREQMELGRDAPSMGVQEFPRRVYDSETSSVVSSHAGRENEVLRVRFYNYFPDPDTLVHDYFFSTEAGRYIPWIYTRPDFVIPANSQFHDIIVPTVDTIRYSYLLSTCIDNGIPLLFVGPTGTGKSILVKDKIHHELDQDKFTGIAIQFSGQTNAVQTQKYLEAKMISRRQGVLGPDLGKRGIIFVDDISMPQKDKFGSQPSLELLRQLIDSGGMYSMKGLRWQRLEDCQLLAAQSLRGELPDRLLRHFNVISLTEPTADSLEIIYSTILDWFMRPFSETVKELTPTLVKATIFLFEQTQKTMLPTPTKAHYLFNLRDLSDVFRGVCSSSCNHTRSLSDILRLWYHECSRVFCDRLVLDDRPVFHQNISAVMSEYFGQSKAAVIGKEEPIFAYQVNDAVEADAPAYVYQEIRDLPQFQKYMEDAMDHYNVLADEPMNLVLFQDALEHICRISRILRQPHGHALCIGYGGSGRHSAARLAAHMAGFDIFEVVTHSKYGLPDWREDMKRLLLKTGLEEVPTLFLFNDGQVKYEEFLEDICNLINTGEIPGILSTEDFETIAEHLRPYLTDTGASNVTNTVITRFFVSRCRENLHACICMSPVGSEFRNRIRLFPALVNCCTIDWFLPWSEKALRSVAEDSLHELHFEEQLDTIVNLCISFHRRVMRMATRFQEETHRVVYITPSSYLNFLSVVKDLMVKRFDEIENMKRRYANGLQKLFNSEKDIRSLKDEQELLEPQLLEKRTQVNAIIKEQRDRMAEADATRLYLQREEEKARAETDKAALLRDECDRDLQKAMPTLQAAIAAVENLKKKHIAEVRVMNRPPPGVRMVMECICIMLEIPPDRVQTSPGVFTYDYWPAAQRLLAENFREKLTSFDYNHIEEEIIESMRRYLALPELEPSRIRTTNVAAMGLCAWIRALEAYHRISREIAPKQQALAEADELLAIMQRDLDEKRAALNKVLDEISRLEKTKADADMEMQQTEDRLDQCVARLERATKLINGLKGEKGRWTALLSQMDDRGENIVGDVLMCSGIAAYQGAFTLTYRRLLCEEWAEEMRREGVSLSEGCTLASIFGDPLEIQSWNMRTLPPDSYSIDNAMIMKLSSRWPLLIDPQLQANRWLRAIEPDLLVLKQTDSDFQHTLESAVQFGSPVLLENVEEEINPILMPLLSKRKGDSSNSVFIGDAEIEFSSQFRLYITSRIPNPHFRPEVSTRVAVVNFAITFDGLDDQLLGVVVTSREPELEEERNTLIQQYADNMRQQQELEEKILVMLADSAEGNILDDHELIQTLYDSKRQADTIERQMKRSSEQQAIIAEKRQHYAPVAALGTVLHFCLRDISNIDPMYQFSLNWFKALYSDSILRTKVQQDVRADVNDIKRTFVHDLYVNVCRSLFEKDKRLLSFMMAVRIMQSENVISPDEWRFFMTGSLGLESETTYNICSDWLAPKCWSDFIDLCKLPAFSGLREDLQANMDEWRAWSEARVPHLAPLPGRWRKRKSTGGLLESVGSRPTTPAAGSPSGALSRVGSRSGLRSSRPGSSEGGLRSGSVVDEVAPSEDGQEDFPGLSAFQQLLIIRTLRPDKLLPAVTHFVSEQLGSTFIEPPGFDILESWQMSGPEKPIIFILSPGADPVSLLSKFADSMGMRRMMRTISLGKGVESRAISAVREGMKSGHWVLLQNCHLVPSWLGELERLTDELYGDHIHKDFRLWLTSNSTPLFPLAVLQQSVKVTNQAPEGLRPNMIRSYTQDPVSDPNFYQAPGKPGVGMMAEWQKMLFSLAFFHAAVQERRNFASLGWNVPYEFSDSDFRISVRQLHMMLLDYREVPFKALSYLTSECNYGGRVTDHHDRRALVTLLEDFYNPDVLRDHHLYCELENGVTIRQRSEERAVYETYLSYLHEIPSETDPEVVGLHSNAEISRGKNQTQMLLADILSTEGTASSKQVGNQSVDKFVNTVCTDVLARLPDLFDLKSIKRKYRIQYEDSMNIVLVQELIRYNSLLEVVRDSLQSVQKAIQGLIVMGADVEDVYTSLYAGHIPELWLNHSYPSEKNLGSYVKDLLSRLQFFQKWVDEGPPPVFWLSGFFFTQSFLTGVRQNFARKYRAPIDEVVYTFEVMDFNLPDSPPEEGCYVHGLYLEGARWDLAGGTLEESLPRVLHSKMPVIWLKPVRTSEEVDDELLYECPVYKTPLRRGELSTTGHSTNFVMDIKLWCPPEKSPSHWIKRGVALLCQVD